MNILFSDPHLARDAEYTARGGVPCSVRVMFRRPDSIATFAAARVWSETALFDIRVSEVPNPRPGDTIALGEESFVVQGEPVRDREWLIWTVEARPA